VGGGGNVDMIIIQRRFWPVGSVQLGNYWVAAKRFVAVEPLIMNITNAKIMLIENCLFILFLLFAVPSPIFICYI